MFRSIFRGLSLTHIKANKPLFYTGDNGDRFYVVLTGEMAICVPRTQEEILNLSSIPYDQVSKRALNTPLERP